MKHHRLVTKKPQLSQSNFEAWKTFMVNLTDQIVEFVFIKTS